MSIWLWASKIWPRVVLVGSIIAFVGPAAAETLTLEQAIERALTADPRVEEKEHLVMAAKALLQEAKGGGDLKVDLNTFLGISPAIDGGFFKKNCPTPESNACVRDDRFTLDDGVSAWFRLELSLIKPLFTFGKIENYSEAANANIAIKKADVRLQRSEIIQDTKRAYFGHLTAKDSRLFLQDIQQRIDNALQLVGGWLDEGEGDVKASDRYALESASALASKFISQAQGLEQVSLDGLKVVTGIGLDNELALADEHLQPVALPTESLPVLQARAAEKRPEISQLSSGLEARRALVAANKAMLKPNVYAGIVGLLSYSPGRDRIDNPHLTDPFNDYGVTPVVGMQWSWETGRQSAKVAQAQAKLNALIEKSSFARTGIAFQVAEQFNQMQAYYASVQSLRKAAKAARRWMISSYTDFSAGVEKVDGVISAFQAYVLAYTEYLRTVFEYNMYVARLEHVTGAYQ